MKKTWLISFLGLALTGCGYLPYQPHFSQGNILTQEKIAAIHSGMTADQVTLVLGTPVLTNTFANNQWNYVYTIQHGPYIKKYQRLIITFNKGRVSSIEHSTQR